MSPESNLQTKTVFLGPDDAYPFYVTAKEYSSPALDACKDNPEALTLIFLHSTGFHKEIWEPTLEDLFECLSSRKRALISDVWTIECPNHGESAVLNEDALQLPRNRQNFTCEKYALAAHRFLLAGPSRGAEIDFTRRKLVGIGHSLGGVAVTILQRLEPRVSFQSIILVEPMLSPGGRECLKSLRFDLVRGAYERRDVWPDRKRALEALKQRGRTRMWDPRSLDVFIKYGLRTHPGAKFRDTPYEGVTLCCSRDEEAAMYRDVDGATKPVLDLNEVCSRLPVHIIFGAIIDHMPQKVYDAIVDPSSPRRFASISRIENAGHLVPQHAPKVLANCIAESLSKVHEFSAKMNKSRSKL